VQQPKDYWAVEVVKWSTSLYNYFRRNTVEPIIVYGVQLPLPLDYSHTSTLPIPGFANVTYPNGTNQPIIVLPKEYYKIEGT
jgi:hypothetical protein